jgi:hypothetical protein
VEANEPTKQAGKAMRVGTVEWTPERTRPEKAKRPGKAKQAPKLEEEEELEDGRPQTKAKKVRERAEALMKQPRDVRR